LQRFVAGRRHNHYFAARRGRILRLAETRILRTNRPDGTGLAVEGVSVAPDAERVAHLEALLGAVDYTGIGCAQYLVDAAGRTTAFLENNPRVAGSHAVPEGLGLELSRLAIDLATGRADDAPIRIAPAGVRYAWTYGDLRELLHTVAGRQMGPGAAVRWGAAAALALIRARVHMTWSWRDPVPTLAQMGRLVKRLHHAAASATARLAP